MLAQRRLLILFLLAWLGSVAAWAQGGSISGQVFNTDGTPASAVPVRLCPYGSSGIPCSPVSNIYSDPAETQPIANPYTTDAYGNFSFFVGVGNYLLQITVGTVTYSQVVTSNGNASVSSVALTMPGIFSVAGSPITSAGTFVVTFNSQTQNLAFMSPNGSSGTPLFRSIVVPDLPFTYSGNTTTLATVSGSIANTFVAGDASGNLIAATLTILNTLTVNTLTVPTSLILSYIGSGNCLQTTAGGAVVGAGFACGSVTSVGLTMPGIFSVVNSPVTGAATIAVSLQSQTQNLAWMSPNGAPGAPVFRSIVTADLPFTYSGNTTKLATVSGSFTAGNTVVSDASGNLIDSGSAPSIQILAKVNQANSCQLASDPNGQWSCNGSLGWGTTLANTNYNVTCTLTYPQASIWPSGTYGYSRAGQGDFFTLVKSTGSFTYLIVDDHSGSNGATYTMDCMAYE